MHRAALSLALLLACGRPPAEKGPFVLRLGVMAPMGWEGPGTGAGGAAAATDLVYEAPLYPVGDRLLSPFLESWQRDEQGRWVLAFQPGRSFSDGRPVTSEDLARSLRAGRFRVAREAGRVVAESQPDAGAGDLAGLLLTPVASGEGPDALGTGPFAVAERSEERMLLRRVVPAPGRVDAVEFVAFASSREAFAQLLRGRLNAAVSLDRHQVELLDGVPGIRVISARAPNAVVAFLNPRRLSREERRALADALPLGEVAARAGLGSECGVVPPRRPLPAGRALRIGYGVPGDETSRAALALRRALGARGGEVVPVAEMDALPASSEVDILIRPALVWPTAMLATALESGARFNPFGYANPNFDAAVHRGDGAGATAALRDDPPMLVICRRQRHMAVDARILNATVSEWGVLDTLPQWQVGP